MYNFHDLSFRVTDGQVRLTRFGALTGLESRFVEVQIAGENKDSHTGNKQINSSEGERLRFVSMEQQPERLCVYQQSELIRTATVFQTYADTKAVQITTTVTNRSSQPLVLESVSSFFLLGLGGKQRKSHPDGLYLTDFLQSHHAECQPRRRSFREIGLFAGSDSQKRAAQFNAGNWSTKEALPQGILEDEQTGTALMFQIESGNSWYFEVSDWLSEYYLWLGGANLTFGSWARELLPGESYTAPTVCLTVGQSLNEIVGDMTAYRRHIAGTFSPDAKLPVIFNSYMHLCWDGPTEASVRAYAPAAAACGAEYYVIDCGWHNEEDCLTIYRYMGQWKESRLRFPDGVKKSTDFIRSLGMKPGLWIEPEIIGYQCRDMLEYYDDSCFLQRFGRPIIAHNRMFLDYRQPKVRRYMTETIRRMVEDYGAAYIKFDYNHDYGVGTHSRAFSLGSGLEDCSRAFLDWVRSVTQRFPDVIFEGCASGGMRLDYQTLRCFSMASSSDQTDYLQYPYIAGNILSAVLPEQAAVWSYPVRAEQTCADMVSDDAIVINMVNSLLGRVHLASHLERLNPHQTALVREAIACYHALTPVKKQALPCFPLGFTGFGAAQVCAGLRHEAALYLAVWQLHGREPVQIPLPAQVLQAQILYPADSDAVLSVCAKTVTVTFPRTPMAVFLKVTTACVRPVSPAPQSAIG